MYFASIPLREFRPLRGKVFSGTDITKSEECRRLEHGGFRIPRTAVVTETETPDISDFGPYVVVKPDIGRRGAMVKIMRTAKVRWEPPEVVSHSKAESADLLVQEFIYTGKWPVSYRVHTLFGEALGCVRIEANNDRPALPERFGFREAGGGLNIVASSMGCELSLVEDKEMIDIAERTHALFPECAQLGVDLIREVPTGDVHVLEVNSRGGVWMLSSSRIDESCGGRVADQRDAFRRAGRLFAEAAIRLSE